MTVADYIKQLLSFEEFAFSLGELRKSIEKSETSIKSELSRLIEKHEILNLRKGFYLIIPPRYSKLGQLPIQLYIDKLFKSLDRCYYLGLYSAAKFHGAGHQQSQRDYVMTQKPKLYDIKKETIDIRYFTTSNWPDGNIIERKSDAGIFKISSPALTAVDLIHHQTKLGGLNRMLANLEELSEEITFDDLQELLKWYPQKSTLQRLGFLLEQFQVKPNITNLIRHYLSNINYYPVLLSPNSNQKAGSVDNQWKVDVNVKLESDI